MAYQALLNDPQELEKMVYSARSCWEQHLIADGTLKNRMEGGAVTGFDVGIRTCWYRSLAITLIRRLELRVDHELIPQEDIFFQVEDDPHVYRLDEIGTEQADEYWYLNRIGWLHIRRPGGLPAGPHKVEVVLEVFITYHNYPDVTYQEKILTITE